MKPQIYAKSTMSHEQINAKLKAGCDGIEIQLLDELYKDNNRHVYKKVEDVWDLSEFAKYPIKCVHSPLSDNGDILLEMICDLEDRILFEELFKLTQYFGEIQNNVIPLIIHSESFYEALLDLGSNWYNIRNTVKSLLDKYPKVSLLIENVTPVRGIDKSYALHLCNNWAFDNIKMTEVLRREIGTERVGTVLDTCHAMITDKYISGIHEIAERPKPDCTIRNYLLQNRPYCGIIHLAGFKGSGYGPGKHGTPFDEESYDKLCEILSIYEELDYSCPLTLEVGESDYKNVPNYRTEKFYVDKYFSEK